MAASNKVIKRQKVRYRLRKTINGTALKPRLSVFRSNSDIYAQLINDVTGTTIVSASSKEKDIKAQNVTKTEKSKLVGESIGKKAAAIGITTCVFDRSGYIYHGRVKAIAEGAREAGIKL
jgi:large subunit ribosomal protein L18